MPSIAVLNYASYIIEAYMPLICFILGTVGLCLNCILLTRRIFRNNPCATYFLASTFANIIVLLFNNFLIILQTFDNIQIATMNVALCKIQRYISWMSRALSVWLIVLATIDRYLNSFSDVNIRSWSSMKVAKRSIFIITITMIIIYIHMLIFYQLFYTINSNGNIVSSVCNPQAGFYAIFSSILHVIIYSCLPIILMCIFGILTLKNLKRQRQLIAPMIINSRTLQQRGQLDNQLLKMLLIQVLVISITTLPLSVQRIYSAFTSNISKSLYRIAQEGLFSNIAQGFSYIAHSTTFYLFMLSGRIYREELKRLFIKLTNYFHCIGITPIRQTHTISQAQPQNNQTAT